MLTNEQHAVPAGEYMNPAQQSFFAALLRERLDDVLADIDRVKASMGNLGSAADPLDQAVIEDERHSLARSLERLNQKTKEILNALQSIKDNEYGWCEDTGEEIGIDRLLAQPTARFSAVAQTYQEGRMRQFNRA